MKSHAMKSKSSQTKTASRLDAVLGALDKKAPASTAARGSCTRFIYCI